VLRNLLLAGIGGWVVAGLSRAASAKDPSPDRAAVPALGAVEASLVLGGLCVLYAAFVAAQFVALSGGGHHVLVTQGLTYAQYARGGFFQLLACAAITLPVLLSVRACAGQAGPVLRGLSGLTVILTIGVVFVAIRRLQLYEAVFGLTMLRLACLVVAVWIGIVFGLLGLTLPRRGLPSHWFPAAVVLSGLLLVGVWGASNPASIVARVNVHRAEHGHRLDVAEVASLGPDAVPALVGGLRQLGGPEAAEVRRAICARPPRRDSGAAFNMSAVSAVGALVRICGPRGRPGDQRRQHGQRPRRAAARPTATTRRRPARGMLGSLNQPRGAAGLDREATVALSQPARQPASLSDGAPAGGRP